MKHDADCGCDRCLFSTPLFIPNEAFCTPPERIPLCDQCGGRMLPAGGGEWWCPAEEEDPNYEPSERRGVQRGAAALAPRTNRKGGSFAA